MSDETAIEYWDLEDPCGHLQWGDMDEAIEGILDGFYPEPCPREIKICGWTKKVLSLSMVKGTVDHEMETVWERLDEDFCHEDGDTHPTKEGAEEMDRAAAALAEAIHKHYPVMVYESGTAVTIDCVQWVSDHRPDWIAAETWRGFQPEEDAEDEGSR